MDPQKNAGGDVVFAPNAGYTLIAMAFLIKSASWMVSMVTDGAAEADGSMPITQAMVDLINGPLIDILCVLMVIGGGFIIIFGGSGKASGTEIPPSKTKPPRALPLQMSELAQSAEGRLNSLMAQFRSIPEDMVLAEAAVEFERIESSHVPDLQQAHRDSRATVPAKSAKSDALDAGYAASLDRVSDALARLIEGCEAVGRERLEIQSRFIEARHPKDAF